MAQVEQRAELPPYITASGRPYPSSFMYQGFVVVTTFSNNSEESPTDGI